MPDVILSMISGSKRIAYYRIPAYEIMFSENPFAKGEFCGRTQNIVMKVSPSAPFFMGKEFFKNLECEIWAHQGKFIIRIIVRLILILVPFLWLKGSF